MGRSVSQPRNSIVVAFNTWGKQPDDWDETKLGEWHGGDFEMDVIWDVQNYAPTLWPSLEECDQWLGREDHAILENCHCYVGVSEYCGMVAYWIVAKDDDERRGLHEAWCRKIAAKFEQTFGKYRKLGNFSNGTAAYKAIAPDGCASRVDRMGGIFADKGIIEA